MFELRPLPRFRRNLKKLLRKDRALAKPVSRTLTLLAHDPRNTALQTHKVVADDGRKVFSSEVTSDLRIIWRYSPERLEQIDLLNIGGHSGAKKVYS